MTDKEITIHLKTLTGKNVSFTGPKTTTFKTIKQWLQDREGIPTNLNLLVYSGASLDDNDTLETYNIQNNETINVILKMRGD